MIPGSNRFFPGSHHTQQQQQNNVPKTMSEVSAKLKLCQLSTLGLRHSFGEEGNWEENCSFTVVTG